MSIPKDSRIAIIGAGPAGLAAGMYLEQAGFHDYTILERTDHVGGKCHSPNYHGRRYEMGAIMGVPSYDTTQEIMNRTGDKVDGPKLRREFLHEDGEIYVPEKDPVRGPQVMAAVQKLGQLLATKYQGYDANGHYNKVHEDLMLPFDEFLAFNGCEAARDLWINPFTAFGYGHFDNVPAAYVLKYLDFVTMMSFAKGDLWTWADGTQAMFEHLNAALEHPAERNVDITRITREDGKVHIHTTDWDRESDVLVLTVPLEKFLDYSDADDDEREYFSKIIHQQYMVDACLVKEYPTISGYVPDNMRPERLGHVMVYYHRWADDPHQIITTYLLRNHPDYADKTQEECRQMVLDDMETFGHPVEKIVEEQTWYYFPHVSSEDYKAGWYEKVEGMQGRLNTFYAGEIMSFGNFDEVCHYSKDLVTRFFV